MLLHAASCGKRVWLGQDQRGASAVEYALLIGFIAAVIVLAVGAFGLSVADLFQFDLNP